MQKYLEALKSAWRSIKSNKMRSFLTTLGVSIGTFAVIGLVSIVSGLKAEIKSEIVGLGAEMLDIIPSETGDGVGFGQPGAYSSFSKSNANAVRNQATSLEYFSENYQTIGQYVRGKKEEKNFLMGIGPDYFKIRNKKTIQGRLYTNKDEQQRAKVIVIGEGLANDIFGASNPIGKELKVNGTYFEVIGVLEKETMKIGSMDINKVGYIPVSTTERVFPETKINEMFAKVKDDIEVNTAVKEIEQILREELENDEFSVLTQDDMLDLIDRVTGIISTALAGVASISLLVGGIGIMNIMLVSVTERTKEIGLRKALGAEKNDILAQFLIEAVILCLCGGIAGIAVSEAASFVVTTYFGLPSMIDVVTVIAAVAFSISVGLIFGTAPALKAANLDPIEALRHE